MKRLLFVLITAGVLSGCGLTKEKLGIAHKAPDENMVTVRQPLSVPPEYDLRPVAEVRQGE
ncbi:MAG: DUF3035 domain-containing protein [Alphaproteobacteria bacterium]|nr:DUF3035 domain-containing protein [Alphaproteobacteria bacterium]